MVIEERVTLKNEADRRIKKMSQEYVQLYKSLHEEFEKYKEFISFELEGHENVKTGLEKEITKRETSIEDLKEALSLPRQHYKFIENLMTDEILKQKNEII